MAEWTEESLGQALMRAHQAGDRNAAEMLTQEILRLRGPQPEPPEREPIPTGEGMLRATGQGGTYGYMDEITAAGAAALHPLVHGESGKDFGERYDAYVARERGKLGQFREESPVLATGAEIAGAIPTAMVAPQGPATQGMSMLGRMGTGAAVAGGHGAFYGSGQGEGSLADRLKSAGKVAAIAAPIGAAAPLVARGVENVANYIGSGRSAQQLGLPRPAYDAVNRQMGADQSLTGAGAANIQRAGPQAMPVDAGPNARRMLDVAIQKSGPAGVRAGQAVDQRVTGAADDIGRAMDDAFGQPVGIRQLGAAIRREGAEEISSRMRGGPVSQTPAQAPRGDAYDAAYARLIDYSGDEGGQLAHIVATRVPRSAVNTANRLMRAEGLQSQQIRVSVGDDGVLIFENLPSVQQIDYITRGLNEVSSRAQGQGKIGGVSDVGRVYGRLAREIRDLTRGLVPEYDTALRTAATDIQAREALEVGGKALRAGMTRDALEELIENMTPAARTYAAQGVRSQIDDAMANVQRAFTDPNMDAREAAKALRMLSSRASRDKVATIIGDEPAARLFDQLDQATAAFELKASVAGNSATFARTSLEDAISSQTDEGVLNAMRSGEPVNAAKRLTQIIANRTPEAKERISDETYSAIVAGLTGPRGPQAQQWLQNIVNAQQNPVVAQEYGRLAEMLMRRTPGAISAAGTAAIPTRKR